MRSYYPEELEVLRSYDQQGRYLGPPFNDRELAILDALAPGIVYAEWFGAAGDPQTIKDYFNEVGSPAHRAVAAAADEGLTPTEFANRASVEVFGFELWAPDPEGEFTPEVRAQMQAQAKELLSKDTDDVEEFEEIPF